MIDKVRAILDANGKLAVAASGLGEFDDLFAAGLDSLAMVNVLMAIEEEFDIEIPDRLLSRRTFSSLHLLTSAINELTRKAA